MLDARLRYSLSLPGSAMRLPTNNLALAAVGFAAFLLIAPILVILMYVMRIWKAGRRHGGSRDHRPMLQTLLEHIFEFRP